nr:hypothetical protein CFP56_20469 [Quercus suber]
MRCRSLEREEAESGTECSGMSSDVVSFAYGDGSRAGVRRVDAGHECFVGEAPPLASAETVRFQGAPVSVEREAESGRYTGRSHLADIQGDLCSRMLRACAGGPSVFDSLRPPAALVSLGLKSKFGSADEAECDLNLGMLLLNLQSGESSRLTMVWQKIRGDRLEALGTKTQGGWQLRLFVLTAGFEFAEISSCDVDEETGGRVRHVIDGRGYFCSLAGAMETTDAAQRGVCLTGRARASRCTTCITLSHCSNARPSNRGRGV